jgi:VanZ family protein
VRIEIPTAPAFRAACFVAFLGMVAQLLLLSEPDYAETIVSLTWDKAIHGLYFGTMAFLLWVATGKRWTLAVWLVVLAVGAADETLQAFTPGRDSDVRDWIADGLGAALALLIARRIAAPAGRPAARFTPETGDEKCAES